MGTLTVESANTQRNRYLLWLAVSWPLVYLPFMLSGQSSGRSVFAVATAVSLMAFIFMTVALVKLVQLLGEFKKHPEVARALKEEIFAVYKGKALNLAYFMMILLLFVLGPVRALYPVPSFMIFRILFFIGIEVCLISYI